MKFGKKRVPISTTSAVLIIASLVLAFTAAQSQESSRRDGFFVRNIYDWRAIDNENLVIWAPNRKNAYLVRLASYCHGLNFAETLVVDSKLPYLDSSGLGHVVIFNPTKQRCAIDTLERVDDYDTAVALIKGEEETEMDDDAEGNGT